MVAVGKNSSSSQHVVPTEALCLWEKIGLQSIVYYKEQKCADMLQN